MKALQQESGEKMRTGNFQKWKSKYLYYIYMYVFVYIYISYLKDYLNKIMAFIFY